MLSHARIWAVIDQLAAAHDLTASGLARQAGLDSTTFNRSKRFASDGRPRWPSTESIAKILGATGTDLATFLGFGETGSPRPASKTSDLPVLGLAQAGAGGFFDDSGFPTGLGWERIEFPGMGENVFALEITGESMLPLYRHGDKIIVARDTPCRRGDKVVIKTRGGEVMAKILRQQGAQSIELLSFNPDHPARTLAFAEIEWMARIVWVSQ